MNKYFTFTKNIYINDLNYLIHLTDINYVWVGIIDLKTSSSDLKLLLLYTKTFFFIDVLIACIFGTRYTCLG